jgi:hypothetical protein
MLEAQGSKQPGVKIMYQTYTNHQFPSYATNPQTNVSRIATSIYNRMVWMGKVTGFLYRLIGRSRELQDLQKIARQQEIIGRNYLGQRAVQLTKIVGSESRSRDFDLSFHPIQENTQDRWVRVAAARLNRIGLPPVELIKLGENYYVRDGHHRISVARAFGEVYIDALITEWKASADQSSLEKFVQVPA